MPPALLEIIASCWPVRGRSAPDATMDNNLDSLPRCSWQRQTQHTSNIGRAPRPRAYSNASSISWIMVRIAERHMTSSGAETMHGDTAYDHMGNDMNNSSDDETPSEREEISVICFVIGPIGDKLADPGTAERQRYERSILTLDNIILPACEEIGIGDPIRADKMTIAGEIPEQVFRSLRDADIVIADVTDGNPNVMYELGLRHTRNKLTIQIGEQGKLPFDINSIRTIKFRRSEGGYIDAKNALRDMLESGLTGQYHPVAATRVWLEDTSGGGDEDDGFDPGTPGPRRPPSDQGPAGGGARVAERLEEAADLQAEVADDVTEGNREMPGYLELLADAEDTLPRINQTLIEIGAVTEEFGAIAELGKEEIQQSDRRGEGAKGRLLAAIRFAERLDEPVARLGALASSLRTDLASVDPALDYIFSAIESEQYQSDEVPTILKGLNSFVTAGEAAAEAKPSIKGFRSSVVSLADVARPVRVRTSKLAHHLEQIVDATTAFMRWGERAKRLGQQVQAKYPDVQPSQDKSDQDE